jgi:putative oxidoreductase
MFLSKYETQIYATLRVVAGFLFLWHGSQKFFNFPLSGHAIPMNTEIIIGGTVELLGGLLIMLGLFTRWAAFITSGEMAYAYWTVHVFKGALPLINGGELAMLYCFLFLFISAKGSGIFSIDQLLEKRKQKPQLETNV